MVLASHLLKHHLIALVCPSVSWWDISLTVDEHKKPIYLDADGKEPVRFNVSHQAGLVVLVAVVGYDDGEVDVGVDVVCTSERRDRDRKSIMEDRGGWPGFVDVYSDVFARSETNYLKYSLLSLPNAPRGSGEEVVDFKLRCFYTLWCLREAYVKMTAEALMAKWLDVLEFRNFVPPQPTEGFGVAAREGTGEVAKGHEILFRGRRVDDVNLDLRSVGEDYMIATAVRTRPDKGVGLGLGGFEMVDLEEIVRFAESRI